MIWRDGFYTLSTAKLDRAFQREVALQLRLAEIQDAEAITALINTAFRLAESFLIDRDRIDLESVRGLLEKGQFLVADDGGVLAGCVYLELRGDRGYLGLLAVDPDRQKAGLGSTLMNAIEDHCSTAACGFMDLQIVSVRQELPAFYRRRGYVETGTAPFPPGLDPKLPCHFVTMSKSLT
jgi:N-acetylglutamate synthase-like GNAT family acetyltransferase